MQQDEIVSLLPRVVQRSILPGEPLDALLAAMAGLQAPTEQLARDVQQLARPWQAPEAMLPYLARWLDVDGVLALGGDGAYTLTGGTGQLRELIEAAAEIAQWRGTARGLALFLRSATGVDGFAIEETVLDEHGRPRPFVIRVVVPGAAADQRGVIERVIRLGKPAYVQCLIDDAVPASADPASADPPSALGAPDA
ncbi:MAG: repeat domain protein [Pseudonocardiales bacterium]|nr:repeat domain protein [Jatrophihabitantaceae bacterium]MCW2604782.1 repeat domain protein [Pseudonocardiales bacterium]